MSVFLWARFPCSADGQLGPSRGGQARFRKEGPASGPVQGYLAHKKQAQGAPEAGGSYSWRRSMKKRTPLGPYRRPMPRVLGGSYVFL